MGPAAGPAEPYPWALCGELPTAGGDEFSACKGRSPQVRGGDSGRRGRAPGSRGRRLGGGPPRQCHGVGNGGGGGSRRHGYEYGDRRDAGWAAPRDHSYEYRRRPPPRRGTCPAGGATRASGRGRIPTIPPPRRRRGAPPRPPLQLPRRPHRSVAPLVGVASGAVASASGGGHRGSRRPVAKRRGPPPPTRRVGGAPGQTRGRGDQSGWPKAPHGDRQSHAGRRVTERGPRACPRRMLLAAYRLRPVESLTARQLLPVTGGRASGVHRESHLIAVLVLR